MRFEEDSGFGSTSPRRSVVTGAIIGLLPGIVAIYLALLSIGPGHGDYAAARFLFPIPMLLTLIQDDSIGPLSVVLAIVQFPFYGGLLSWGAVREAYVPVVTTGSLHIIAVIACFAGALPNFS